MRLSGAAVKVGGNPETSLGVRWLRLRAPNAGGPASIPGQGTRFHMPQLKILSAAMKTEDPGCSNSDPAQPNKLKECFFKWGEILENVGSQLPPPTEYWTQVEQRGWLWNATD